LDRGLVFFRERRADHTDGFEGEFHAASSMILVPEMMVAPRAKIKPSPQITALHG
jgi:hypothetical protein